MCKKHPHPHSLVHLALVLYHKMLLACGISSTGSIDKFSNRVRTVTFKVVDLIDGIESSKFDSALQTQRLRCLFFLTWRRKMFFCCSFVIKKQSIQIILTQKIILMYSVEITYVTYGINSIISKLMTFVENAETGQFLFLGILILSYFTCS
jgi:hypothetical protein